MKLLYFYSSFTIAPLLLPLSFNITFNIHIRFSDISVSNFRVSLHPYQFFLIKIFSKGGKFNTFER